VEEHQAQAWLSAARFEPFLVASDGDYERAIELYDWHAEIAAACFGMVHHFEVLVRNAIDGVLGDGQPQQPIKDTWLMDFDVLQPEGIKQVIVSVERLEKGKGITRGRVVAGVSFGFWAGLFSNHYEELWRHQLRFAFPHGSIMRKNTSRQARIGKAIKAVRTAQGLTQEDLAAKADLHRPTSAMLSAAFATRAGT
jgi:hypothetical protein